MGARSCMYALIMTRTKAVHQRQIHKRDVKGAVQCVA